MDSQRETGKNEKAYRDRASTIQKTTKATANDFEVSTREQTHLRKEAIKEIGETIQSMNAISGGIAAAVEEQTAATREIARNVQQAAQGTSEVSENITGVSRAATETGTAAGQVLTAAGDLSHQAEVLGSELGKFIAKVRAA